MTLVLSWTLAMRRSKTKRARASTGETLRLSSRDEKSIDRGDGATATTRKRVPCSRCSPPDAQNLSVQGWGSGGEMSVARLRSVSEE